MLRKLSTGLIAGALLTTAACGTARVIQRNQAGGVIELQGDRGKAMEQASQEMAMHCGPGNFTVVSEGEEPVGTDTVVREDTATDTATSKSGRRSSTDTSSTTTQSTRTAVAWRVHYQCGGAPAGTMPPPGGPPPAAPPGPPPAAPPSGY